MFAAVLPLLLAVSPLVVDKTAHTVTFTARATEVDPGTMLEFLFVGPGSDRAYEAMFETEASVTAIARAFDEAGIPRGRATGQAECRFWPAGRFVNITPDPWQFVRDVRGEPKRPFVCTGGSRDARDVPIAETNMPCAVFALYSLGQSLLQIDDALDQSEVYGRFVSGDKLPKGSRHVFTVAWNGKDGTEPRALELKPGNLREAIESLKGYPVPLDVTPSFSPELTVAEAVAAAKALSVIDSREVRMNGFAPGQLFYRAFTPDERWRDRRQRLTQPVEVRVGETNVVCTLIDEDWTVEGDDPKLTPREVPIDAISGFKGDSCLFFVRSGEKLGRIYSLMKRLPGRIRNWYVYVD